MIRWEYLVQERSGRDPMLDRTLAYYGQDGWELVALLPIDSSDVNNCLMRIIFKRPGSVPKESGE